MARQHSFHAAVTWTGNTGTGTSAYKAYERTWEIRTPNKPMVKCSNDPMLGGDPSLHNPEDMLIASLSACHMLWYLHLASQENIVVLAYEDRPEGIGQSLPDGSGQFTQAILKPSITVKAGADMDRAEAIHHEVHKYCFIARSVNFPVTYEPSITQS